MCDLYSFIRKMSAQFNHINFRVPGLEFERFLIFFYEFITSEIDINKSGLDFDKYFRYVCEVTFSDRNNYSKKLRRKEFLDDSENEMNILMEKSIRVI